MSYNQTIRELFQRGMLKATYEAPKFGMAHHYLLFFANHAQYQTYFDVSVMFLNSEEEE